jgi:hypothetical protein
MRTLLKRVLVSGYCYGLLPARFVAWGFRTFSLEAL